MRADELQRQICHCNHGCQAQSGWARPFSLSSNCIGLSLKKREQGNCRNDRRASQLRGRLQLGSILQASPDLLTEQRSEIHSVGLLTLGAHAQRGLRYLVCVCVSVTQHLTFHVIIRVKNDNNLLSSG